MRKSLIVPGLVAILALVAGGCSAARTVASLQGVTPLNVNEASESTSVNVRFYQLKSDGKFRSATVESLWTEDKKTLGDESLGDPLVTTVYPATASDKPVTFDLGELRSETRFIGVLALYRKSDAKDNRALVVSVEDVGKKVLLFSGFSVSLGGDKPKDEGK